MTDESAFIKSLNGCEPLAMWNVMLVWADWCEEDGKPLRAAALRWLVKKERHPYHHKVGNGMPAVWVWSFDLRQQKPYVLPQAVLDLEHGNVRNSRTLQNAFMFAITRLERVFKKRPDLLRRNQGTVTRGEQPGGKTRPAH